VRDFAESAGNDSLQRSRQRDSAPRNVRVAPGKTHAMLGGTKTANGGDGNARREERQSEESVEREIVSSEKQGVPVLQHRHTPNPIAQEVQRGFTESISPIYARRDLRAS